jgi:hypothetical protein
VAISSPRISIYSIPLTPDGSKSLDLEKITRSIKDAQSCNFWRPKKPGVDYKVLFCRLPNFGRKRRRVRVGILTPLTPPVDS